MTILLIFNAFACNELIILNLPKSCFTLCMHYSPLNCFSGSAFIHKREHDNKEMLFSLCATFPLESKLLCSAGSLLPELAASEEHLVPLPDLRFFQGVAGRSMAIFLVGLIMLVGVPRGFTFSHHSLL